MIENSLLPLVNSETKVLVVGSMPGKQSLEKQQYYGNKRNHFWGIMEKLLGEEAPEVYNEKLNWLQRHRIGLWDAIAACERQGSLDATIKEEVPNDFKWLFDTYPQIECVVFNGGKAYEVFKRKIGFPLLQHRSYAKLPSTSPIPGKNIQSFDEKVESWKVILPYL